MFGQYGIAVSGATGRPSSATPRWAGRCWAPPAARCWRPTQATADDLLAYLRAPGLLHTPEVADALEADVRREGLRTAAQARERLGWEFDELDELAAGAPSRPACDGVLCRLARRLLAAPHRGPAAQLDRGGDARRPRAGGAGRRALHELSELGLRPPAAELIELLAALPVVPARRRRGVGRGRRGAAGRADARSGPAASGSCSSAACRRASSRARAGGEPFLSDERRLELAAASGLRLRPREDALDGERYLFYAAVSRATERVVPRLPQLR